MRRKRRQKIGANSSANSLRNQGGMPSGPYALPAFRDLSTLRTLRSEIIGEDIGFVRGRVTGSATLESSKEELEENKVPKREAFSAGEVAIVPLGWNKGGKPDLQKFLEIDLAKEKRPLLVGDKVRLLHFLSLKEFLALRSLAFQRFLAALKAAKVRAERDSK